jgi:hypothetical protein
MTKQTVDYMVKILIPDLSTRIQALEIRVAQLEKLKPDPYFLRSW